MIYKYKIAKHFYFYYTKIILFKYFSINTYNNFTISFSIYIKN